MQVLEIEEVLIIFRHALDFDLLDWTLIAQVIVLALLVFVDSYTLNYCGSIQLVVLGLAVAFIFYRLKLHNLLVSQIVDVF